MVKPANLANFIRDVRKDLQVPRLPFVIGGSGFGGWGQTIDRRLMIMKAQAAVAHDEEFKDSVRYVETRGFFRDADAPPYRRPHKAQKHRKGGHSRIRAALSAPGPGAHKGHDGHGGFLADRARLARRWPGTRPWGGLGSGQPDRPRREAMRRRHLEARAFDPRGRLLAARRRRSGDDLELLEGRVLAASRSRGRSASGCCGG
ncbi:MAG: sialate O-acetylesterase [Planctomycetes bacterium]|nr:sialate O-acetylesterase [Planctomycetota bacterium]